MTRRTLYRRIRKVTADCRIKWRIDPSGNIRGYVRSRYGHKHIAATCCPISACGVWGPMHTRNFASIADELKLDHHDVTAIVRAADNTWHPDGEFSDDTKLRLYHPATRKALLRATGLEEAIPS